MSAVHDDDGVVWEHLDGELQLLLPEDAVEPPPPLHMVLANLRTAAHWVESVSDHISQYSEDARAHAPNIAGRGTDVRLRAPHTISRYFIAHPEPVVEAFDGWLADRDREIRARTARLTLGEPVEPDDGQLRVLAARLRLPHSTRPVPMRVELCSWGWYLSVMHLDPAPSFVSSMGWHRRGAYFSCGHACAVRMREEIETFLPSVPSRR